MSKPRILVYDIETSPFEVYTFGLYDQNIGVTQIKEFPTLLSWAAKWVGEKQVMFQDNRNKKSVRDDKALVADLRDLMNEADYLLTQNGKQFDDKFVNARCGVHRIAPPKPLVNIDTKIIAKASMNLPSHSLAYMSRLFDLKNQKSAHARFPGQDLWNEVLAGNTEAWNEMKKYNIQDVRATEETYCEVLRAHDKTFNFVLSADGQHSCGCGSRRVEMRGTRVTKVGVFQRYQCQDCGTWRQGKQNLRPLAQRKLDKVAR